MKIFYHILTYFVEFVDMLCVDMTITYLLVA